MTLASISKVVLRAPTRSKPRTVVGLVAFSLFIDYFLYGMVMPLIPHSPAKVSHHLRSERPGSWQGVGAAAVQEGERARHDCFGDYPSFSISL